MRFDPAKIKEYEGATRDGPREVDIILSADLRALHLGCVEREVRFHAIRKWTFDFAIRKVHLACEIEGAVWTMGRHTRGSGFVADCVKYNNATALGWTVFRFPTQAILVGEAREILLLWKKNALDNQVKTVSR